MKSLAAIAAAALSCCSSLFAQASDGALTAPAFSLDSAAKGKFLSKKLWPDVSLDKFRLTFQCRALGKGKGDFHFGVTCVGRDGGKLMLFTRGYDLRYLKDGKETICGKFKTPMKIAPEAAWTKFSIRLFKGFVEVDVDDAFVGSLDSAFAPAGSFVFHSINADAEFSDLKLEALDEPRKPDASVKSMDIPFHGSCDARLDGALSRKPLKAEGLEFVDGMDGEAVRIAAKGRDGKSPRLDYDVSDVFSGASGSISFWFRPAFDGASDKGSRFLLRGLDSFGKARFSLWLWHWLRADLPREGLGGVSVNRVLRNAFLKGDWLHLGLTWDAEGWVKLYFDGLPYKQGNHWMPEAPQRFGKLDMASLKTLSVGVAGNPKENADGDFSGLKLFSRALSDEEMAAEYRSKAPIELLMDRSVVFSDVDGKLDLIAAPSGFHARPQERAPVAGAATLTLSFVDASGAVLEKDSLKLDLSDSRKIEFQVGRLKPGAYALRCELASASARIQKSFPVECVADEPPRPASDAPLKLGAPVFDADFSKGAHDFVLSEGALSSKSSSAGTCLETSGEGGSRLAFPIAIPSELYGKPVILEISWPDDKPRSMGLYMYPKAATKQHRDRLQGGIQAGAEYPNSGAMRVAKYLFYPGVDSYLFEARTMIKGYPAAISRLRVLPVEGGLPKLEVKRPDGLPGRTLGHLDEDQTPDTNFHADGPRSTTTVAGRICEYFDYTGQSVISYPLMRYDYVCYPLDNFYGGLFPWGRTGMGDFIAVLERHGVGFRAIFNIYTLPDFALAPDKMDEMAAKNFFVVDSTGRLAKSGHLGLPKPDFMNPQVREMLLWHVRQIASRYGRMPGFLGFDLWDGVFARNPDEGYGAATLAAFAKASGVAIPVDDPAKACELLNSPKLRAKWQAWRAAENVGLFKEIVACVKTVDPALSVTLQIGGLEAVAGSTKAESAEGADAAKEAYEGRALDLAALRSIPGLRIAPAISSNAPRWELFWGHPAHTGDEAAGAFENFKAFVPADGIASIGINPRYFETYKEPLKADVYKSYFQDADIKPEGRFFLKQLLYPLAALDASRIQIGAQPLGTLGRDEETREFAKAYCALPALPFDDVKGPRDPVLVRALATENGTYVYFANLLWSELSAKFKADGVSSMTDLSTGGTLKSGDGVFELPLKPYQLRSFLIEGRVPTKELSLASLAVPSTVKGYYAARVADLKNALNAVSSAGEDVATRRSRLAAIEKAVGSGAYAEAHRLIFSKRMNALLDLKAAADSGLLAKKTAMLARSSYAVDCGGAAFIQSPDGRLFLPDQPFDGVYGYEGGYKSVARVIARISKDAELPELYAREAYDLDRYKFKVKPGRYTVRLRFKIGFEPNAKPGKNVLNLDIAGRRVLDSFDVFTALGSDFGKVLVKEFKGVEVSGEILEIKFSIPEGGDPTVRFCNAIEVEPEK